MVRNRFIHLRHSSFRLWCLGLLALPVVFLAGCKKPEEIRTYTVPHKEGPRLIVGRMLGAIIPNDKEAWFFKLQGADEEVGRLESQFIDFTKSVNIGQDKKVTWKAPQAWKERKGGEFRITTYLIPNGDEKPLELAISKLDAPQGVNDQYLVMNLSRWRGQLGKEPINAADIPKLTSKVPFDGGSAWVINMTGIPTSSGGMSMPSGDGPPAGHPPIETPPADEPVTEGPASGEKLEFNRPAGWSPGKPSSMRKASLAVSGVDAVADISVFEFPADANDLLSNVNRWRQQVGLQPVTAEALQKEIKPIDVSGHSGDYVELVGEKDTILGVMVKKGKSAWFFKLQGPTALAGREKQHFEEFVKSARLP